MTALARSPARAARPRRPDRPSASAPKRPRPLGPVVGGAAWAVLLVGATIEASALDALLLGAVAVVATASTLRAARARGRRRRVHPLPLALAVAAAALTPLAALGGTAAALAVLVVLGGGAAGAQWLMGPTPRWLLWGLGAFGPAAAAASVVLARHQSRGQALALVAAVLAFDAGVFIMGHGRSPLGGPAGVASGCAVVAVVALFAAAALDPPFSGARPEVVFGLVGAAMAAGVVLCGRAAGPARLPALRRLDSLLVAGPVWVVALAVIGR